MKVTIGISVLCIAMLWTACKKDTSGAQPMLVRSISLDSNSCSINFTYDAQNRLTAMTQCDTIETYTYTHDTVIDIKTAGGVISYQNIYKLNATGLAAGYTRLGGDGSIAAYVCTYDARGHRLSTVDTTHINTHDNYVVLNNDIISEQSTSSVTGNSYSINTTFYNSTRNTLSNVNFGLSFLGVSSANLKKADSYTGLYTIDYTYLLNNQNGVAQQVSTINGVVTEVRNYTYY